MSAVLRISENIEYRHVRMESGELLTYTGLHNQLRRWFRKPTFCWSCGAEGKVEWALRPDRETYSRQIEAYWPCCRRCHMQMDRGGATLRTVIGLPLPE